ncbi:hypothetical protein [Halapricum hydrolyticum]|uniref:Uncharacterized protein n=1 Tax=Halapricum hydrolyticum TaxID=2979991 RepID=A0AAE3I8F3_9EURY|nr:hypothetical protein [Halapricum hydrolyticum]MCU4716817.1 hypothetical protein [Halapricum hydrolyticum]MCU4725578.1 hypothetical protein [Halapricum hydrolyticum]
MSAYLEVGVRFVGVYIGVAIAAHLFHLLNGVLTVGPAEVRRQVVKTYDEFGPLWYAVFVLTAGLYQRYEVDLEPEIVDYPGGDEL